MTVKHTLYG